MLIGYARVSTVDQNLDLQINALREAGCEEIFQDKLSAVSVIRPGLAGAMSIARSGDTLVVWKLDRLGRRTTDLLDFIKELEAKSIGLKSISDGIDPSGPIGKAIFTIAAAFAELERDLMLERTQRGLEAAKAKGTKFGRPPRITDSQVKVARELLDAPNEDGNKRSLAEIAKVFNVDKSTLSRRLRSLADRE